MSVGEPKLLSYPIRLQWLGWETDTFCLQQAGWQISAEQNIERRSLRFALKYDGSNNRVYYNSPYDTPQNHNLYGMSEEIRFDYHTFHLGSSFDQYKQYDLLKHMRPIHVQLVNKMCIQVASAVPLNFSPIDSLPQFHTIEPKSIEDLILFAPNLVRTQEIIIPEKSVLDLMNEILKKQEPARHEYFTNKARDDKFQASPRQKVHAQIISLVA